ncbi:FAD-binding domain-containing protein [Fusarium austroafricanum]|uniref:ferric-chelate reductase (NADPH) n=1 Tax=Fusarium austroafricanum TaxID=2364996 RepID=A0A8H4KKG1_9HYPO|nr:FAD-binding domain-containing protein [Fusarium austroafricanum]
MDTASWYAISLGSLIVVSIFTYVLLSIIFPIQRRGKILFLRYLAYPQVPKYLRRSGETSWFDIIVLSMFLGANAIVLSVGVSDIAGFIKRSGLISIINLVPLFLGGQMNIIASKCGLGLRTYTRIHRWLGNIAIVEGLLHAIVSISKKTPDLNLRTNVAGLVAASVFLAIPVSSILRQRLYEAFQAVHFTLSLVVLITLYLHIPNRITVPPAAYLLASSCLLVFIGCIRFVLVIYRNTGPGQFLNRSSVQLITFKTSTGESISVSDAIHLHIRLSRGWKHRAGQYVYICMPGVSLTSFSQLHPFYISWWYHDSGYDYAVIILQKQKGFTDRVFSHRGSDFKNGSALATVLEGPYGKELNLDSYGTVLLFATGIGIAGQLPYVTELLEGYNNYEVRTRRIALFWQVDSEIQTALVADRMQQLLKQDTDRILDIHIHVMGNFLSRVTDQGDYVQLGERIDMTYGPLQVRDVIEKEMRQRKGRTVISVCTDDRMSDAIRSLVQSMTDDTISLQELDFCPGPGVLGRTESQAAA